MNRLPSFLAPLSVVLLATAVTAVAAVAALGSRGSGRMNLDEFSRIPVNDNGRVMPIHTLARNNLVIVSGRESFRDEFGNSRPAVEWLADVMVSNLGKEQEPIAFKHKVFRIENEEVLALLHLEPRSGFRYSINEFGAHIGALDRAANQAARKKSEDRTLFDAKVMEVAKRLEIYMGLAQMAQKLHCVPVRDLGAVDWLTLEAAFKQGGQKRDINPAAQSFAKILYAYHNGDSLGLNDAVAEHRALVNEVLGSDTFKSSFEVFFNRFAPDWLCMAFYLIGFALACVSFLGWTEPLRRSAFWLCAFTFALHTAQLIIRMYLQGRPPVTNLYSSAIFIGWGAVGLCLVLERAFPIGIANLVGSVCGFLAQLVGYSLSTDGDTMPALQAVLDTNFWLWTHVTCVTFGYTATFVAGFLGAVYVVLGHVTRVLDKTASKIVSTMIYGIICFALLLSFVGTVLGGLWADYSWGRFWGWDPKENGALIIVLWNALILHARWGGLVKDRGIAVLAIGGNIVTSWSWFGVNMLGVGLHSYGFMDGAVFWLGAWCVLNLLLIGIGMTPLHAGNSSPALSGPRVGPFPSTGIRPAGS